jgi:hypothetical protein
VITNPIQVGLKPLARVIGAAVVNDDDFAMAVRLT